MKYRVQALTFFFLYTYGSLAGEEGLERPPITNLRDFWNLGAVAEDRVYPLRAEIVVYYYDRDWRIMWVESEGGGTYLDPGPRTLPIEPGQRVLLDGAARPGHGEILWDRTEITVLEAAVEIPPFVIEGGIDSPETINLRMIEMEGLAGNQVEIDDTHLRFDLVSEDARVTVFVYHDSRIPVPRYEGAIVLVQGVFSVNHDSLSNETRLEVWIDNPDNVEIRSWLREDPRFDIPASPLEALREKAGNEPVRIEGTVHRQVPGESMTVRDATGQVRLLTRQTDTMERGSRVEAIGYPAADGIEVLLRRSVFRPLIATGEGLDSIPVQGLPRLRLVEHARALSAVEADRRYPVRFEGVVVWTDPVERKFHLQDPTGGIAVSLPNTPALSMPAMLSHVKVEGTTAAGFQAPVVTAESIDYHDSTSVPRARLITFDQASSGAEHGQWVEMRGFVRSVNAEGDHLRLELGTAGGEFSALVAGTVDFQEIEGAVVRIRGVCSVVHDQDEKLVGIRMLVPAPDLVEVEEAAPGDAFATPSRAIGSLLRYHSPTDIGQRTQVSGVVVLHRPGEMIYVQDGDESLLVLSRQMDPLDPGDLVDVVGFPALESGRLTMREAVYRRAGSGQALPEVRLDRLGEVQRYLDGKLVRVQGVLLDSAEDSQEIRLHMQTEGRVYEARLAGRSESFEMPVLRNGALLEIRGVYRVELNEYRQPRSFILDLRSPADIVVLSHPSWWTPERVGWFGAALLPVILLTTFWGIHLSKKNRQLSIAQRNLNEINEGLEQRVSERTLALSQARETLAREKERLRFIFDSVPMGIAFTLFNAGGRSVNLINDTQWRLCGLDDSDKRDVEIFFKITNPDDQVRQTKLHERLEKGEINQYTLEKRYERPDGRTVWVVFSVQRRKYPDGTYDDLSTAVDVTNLKRVEEDAAYERDLLRTLLDHSHDYIYFKDLDSRFIKGSRFHAQMLGLDSPEDMIGKTDFDFYSMEHASSAFRDEQEIIRTGEPMIGKIERESWADRDEIIWVISSKMPLRDKDGRIIGTFGISRNITDLKKAEAELEKASKKLLEASRQAGMAEVATSVLHNVGNVLNSANVSATLIFDKLKGSRVGNLEKIAALLRENKADLAAFLADNPRGRQVPGYIETLGNHLLEEHRELLGELVSLRKNIDHIKDVVSMQQNYAKVSGVSESVYVVDVVEDALSMNEGAFLRHDLSLVKEYLVRPTVTMERHKVLQILVNLMRNAKYACDESGLPEKTLIVRIYEENQHVKIAIIDNGIGIPPENLQKIFAHGFTTRKDGHGFGLHSSANAARELGGALTVHSEGTRKGATFTLELPLNRDAESANGPSRCEPVTSISGEAIHPV